MNQTKPGQEPIQRSFHVVKSAYEEIREAVQLKMRGAALSLVSELFEEEVERLCGSPFSRKREGKIHRGGNEAGSIVLAGQRISVRHPRMRSSEGEQTLTSYTALQSFDLLCERVMKHMISGVSTRDYDGLLDEVAGGTGLKKSSVSKAFVQGSRQALDEINGRDLGQYQFACILVDGIEFGDRMVIAAMGVTFQGNKLLLGLREGDTENSEVTKDLLQSLIERGLDDRFPYLFVIDGSKALKKAIRKVFGNDAWIQRCVRHKERNIIRYLNHGYHMEFRRRWKKLHGFANYEDAKKEYDLLHMWLSQINLEAANSLAEAEMDTLTVIKLQLPSKLRKTLLSTNPLESAFSIVGDKKHRVKNWKTSPDQVSRWAAVTLLEAEKRIRKIRGHREISLLIDALKQKEIEENFQVA